MPGLAKNHDFYRTPQETTTLLIDGSPPDPASLLIEPSAGEGHICRALEWHGYVVSLAVELRAEERERLEQDAVTVIIGDWLNLVRQDSFRDDLQVQMTDAGISIVGNPPWSLACQFIQACLSLNPDYLALLLPWQLPARPPSKKTRAAERDAWEVVFSGHQPTGLHPVPRPSFTMDGKSGVSECGWFVWQKGQSRVNLQPWMEGK